MSDSIDLALVEKTSDPKSERERWADALKPKAKTPAIDASPDSRPDDLKASLTAAETALVWTIGALTAVLLIFLVLQIFSIAS